MGNPRNELAKIQRKELEAEYGGRCAYCGTTLGLEFAHIKHTGLNGMSRGRKERYYDVKRNPDSYILLCSDIIGILGKSVGCHTKFDRGELTLEEILERKNRGYLEISIEPR